MVVMADDKKPPEDVTTPTTTTPVDDKPKDDIELDTAPIVEQVTKEVTATVSKQVAEQATKDVTAKVRDDIVKSIQGDKPAPKDQSPWEKEGRQPKSYDEVAKHGEDRAIKRIRAEQKVADDKKVEADKRTEDQTKEKEAKQSEYWNTQLKQLVEEGHIPAPHEDIQTKLDKNEQLTEKEMEDPGVKARANLWARAREAKEPNLRLVYFEHLKNEKPAGASAPVIGSRKSVNQAGKEEYTYEDIHNKTTDQIRSEG